MCLCVCVCVGATRAPTGAITLESRVPPGATELESSGRHTYQGKVRNSHERSSTSQPQECAAAVTRAAGGQRPEELTPGAVCCLEGSL